MIIAAIAFAASLAASGAPFTNAVPRDPNAAYSYWRKRRPQKKRREDMNPVEAWHNFVKPNGKVEFQKDTRPKPYKTEETQYKDRKPRKPQPAKQEIKK